MRAKLRIGAMLYKRRERPKRRYDPRDYEYEDSELMYYYYDEFWKD